MFEGRKYLISNEKYLKLDIEFPHEEIFKEAEALRDKFVEYRSSYKTHGWYSLPIIGKSSKEPYAWDTYYKSAKEAAPDMQWTDIANQCPVTKKWLEDVYPSNSYARVRFMLLEPGGFIEPHIDTEHSVLGAINVAITNPKECFWEWEDGETLTFNPGDSYAMNLSYKHSVRNNSNENRYHLIVHHYDSTDEYLNLMETALRKTNASGHFHFSTELF